jgi:hypothetical protein
MRNQQGFFFAGIGGHNAESHNHNDVGSFSLFLDNTPMLIDVGVGTYTRQTFSNERYSIWYMQSDYHNVPMINGASQLPGAQYKAKDVSFDSKRSVFSVDVAAAYGPQAAVQSWKRSYKLSSNGLAIEDEFKLTETKKPAQLNFMTFAKPDTSKAGAVLLSKGNAQVKLEYDPKLFDVEVEAIPQSDPRLSNVWGAELYRLQLKSKKQQLQGRYLFTITKN